MEIVVLNKEIEFFKSFSNDDVVGFARISEDDNPIHINADFASKSVFRKRVVQGALLVSMFPKIFGTQYPGHGSIYLSQTSEFLKPVFIGDLIKAKATLISFDNRKKQGVFLTECFNDEGDLILKGEATILFPFHFRLK